MRVFLFFSSLFLPSGLVFSGVARARNTLLGARTFTGGDDRDAHFFVLLCVEPVYVRIRLSILCHQFVPGF